MQSDVSFERRLRYQEMAITRLMCEVRLLRDENAELLAQLEAARQPAAAVRLLASEMVANGNGRPASHEGQPQRSP